MGWDEMNRSGRPCPCGGGKYVSISEMDDWNRCRTSTKIVCPSCGRKNSEALGLIAAHEAKGQKLRGLAEREAKERFLAAFLAKFSGSSRKEIGEELFHGRHYPALGTFYAHVKASGSVEAYLGKYLVQELDAVFPKMFKDERIEELLRQPGSQKAMAERVRREYSAFLPADE
jgi:hypothetical protein